MSLQIPLRRSISSACLLILTALCAVMLASAVPARADILGKWKTDVTPRLDEARTLAEAGNSAQAAKKFADAARKAEECLFAEGEHQDWTVGGTNGAPGKGLYCPEFIAAYAWYEAAHYSTGEDRITYLGYCKDHFPKTEQALKQKNPVYNSSFYRKLMLVCNLEILRGNLIDIGSTTRITPAVRLAASKDSVTLFKTLLDTVKKIEADAKADPVKLKLASNVLSTDSPAFTKLTDNLDTRYKELLNWPHIDSPKQGSGTETVHIEGNLVSLLPVVVEAVVGGVPVESEKGSEKADPGQGGLGLRVKLKQTTKVEFRIKEYSAVPEISDKDVREIYTLVHGPDTSPLVALNLRVVGELTLLASINSQRVNRRLLPTGIFTADNLVEQDQVVVVDQDDKPLNVLDAAGKPLPNPIIADANTTKVVVGSVELHGDTTRVVAKVQRNGNQIKSTPVNVAFDTRQTSLAWLNTKDDRIRLAVLRVNDYTAPTGVKVNGISYDIQPYSIMAPEADGYTERLYLLPIPKDGRPEPTVAVVQGKEESRVGFGGGKPILQAQDQEGLIKTLPDNLQSLARYAFENSIDDTRYLQAGAAALAFYQPLADAGDNEAKAVVQYEAKADFNLQFAHIYLGQRDKLPPGDKKAIQALTDATKQLEALAKKADEVGRWQGALDDLSSRVSSIKVRLAAGNSIQETVTPALGLALITVNATGLEATQTITQISVDNRPVTLSNIKSLKYLLAGTTGRSAQVVALIAIPLGSNTNSVQVQLQFSDKQTVPVTCDLKNAPLAAGELQPKLAAYPELAAAYSEVLKVEKDPLQSPTTVAELAKLDEVVRTALHELVRVGAEASKGLANTQLASLVTNPVWSPDLQKEMVQRIANADEMGIRLSAFKDTKDDNVVSEAQGFRVRVQNLLEARIAYSSTPELPIDHQTIWVTSPVVPIVRENGMKLTQRSVEKNRYVFDLDMKQPTAKLTIEANLTQTGLTLKPFSKEQSITLLTPQLRPQFMRLTFDVDATSPVFQRDDLKNHLHYATCVVRNAQKVEYTILRSSDKQIVPGMSKQIPVQDEKALFPLPDLEEGVYTLRVTAISADGEADANDRTSSFQVLEAGGMAFIAAIDAYNTPIKNLPYGISTARDLAKTLVEKYHYNKSNIFMLLGSSDGIETSENLRGVIQSSKLINRAILDNAFNAFTKQVSEKQSKHVLIYLAGHGEIEPDNGLDYDKLIMADNTDNLIAESYAYQLAKIDKVKIIAFYDMCRAGVYKKEPPSPLGDSPDYIGLKSCRPNQHAWSPKAELKLNHTFYGEALISGLVQMADGNGLTIDRLYTLMDAKIQELISTARPLMPEMGTEVQLLPVKSSVIRETTKQLPPVFVKPSA